MTIDENPNPVDSGPSAPGPAELVRDFSTRVIALSHIQLEVAVGVEDRTLTVNLSGPDRPLLLANAACLLNGLEYLVNKAFRTGKGAPVEVILFDSDHYRRHREAELTLLARMASEKVISLRQPMSLQPMTPRERRIVHLALAAIEGVRTESNGTGDNRSVTIYPSD